MGGGHPWKQHRTPVGAGPSSRSCRWVWGIWALFQVLWEVLGSLGCSVQSNTQALYPWA